MLDVALFTFVALGCCALAAIRIAKSRGMLNARKTAPMMAATAKAPPAG
jgi:hypothetical protein